MKLSFPCGKTTLLLSALLSSHLYAAQAIDLDNQPFGYIGRAELNDVNNSGKERNAYLGWFENGAWQGDLLEYTVTKDGSLTTTIRNHTGIPEQSSTATKSNWSANIQFKANENGISHWDSGRKIITYTNGTNQVPFRWNNLTQAQQDALNAATIFQQSALGEKLLNFLRGDRSQETPKGPLRQRYSVLGDIIHSNPQYVGPPNAAPSGDYATKEYANFKRSNKSRDARIYVGANDGMLHAFDAKTGNEVWAYIPSMLIPRLSVLADPFYTHRYFVDGTISVRDVLIGNNWRTVLMSGMSSGAKGLFALDVTDPNLSSESSQSKKDTKVMWEMDGRNDDIGYIFGAISMAKLNDGKWYAVFGNGVNSANGAAKLMLREIGGNNLITISTNSGAPIDPNGLSAPTLVDTNQDGTVDIAYAGDLNGDMWRFNLEGKRSANWKVDYKVYDGIESEPISTAPDVVKHSKSGYMVLFGTGQLYQVKDLNDPLYKRQGIFGIRDTGQAPSASPDLQQLAISNATPYPTAAAKPTQVFTAVGNWSAKDDGWVLYVSGLRALTPPQVRDGRLKILITKPEVPPSYNVLLDLPVEGYFKTNKAIYDLNNDNKIDDLDKIDGNGDGDTQDVADVPIGLETIEGVMAQLTLGSLSSEQDIQFAGYVNINKAHPKVCVDEVTKTCDPEPPIDCETDPTLCKSVDESGIQHIDVDVDTPRGGLNGLPDAHEHAYDRTRKIDYVDYRNLNLDGSSKHNVTSAVLPNQQFIVLIANADLSPGAYITIGKNIYNVVYYQKMIHQALAKWDGTGDLLDPNGKSLIHSLASIAASGGTLRTTFDKDVLKNRGVIPTQTDCMENNTHSATTGRMRNGSLTMHLVKREAFDGLPAGQKAISKVLVQNPTHFTPWIRNLSDRHNSMGGWINMAPTVNGQKVRYAGLRALDNASFLYEGIIFWHWNGECYGTAKWETEYNAIYSQSAYFKGAGSIANPDAQKASDMIPSVIADIIQARIDNGKLVASADTGPQGAAYNAIHDEINKDEDLTHPDVTPYGYEAEKNGVPSPCLENACTITPTIKTSAHNVITGRRSWIDLTPKQ